MKNKIMNAVPDVVLFSTITGTLLLGREFPISQPFPALAYISMGTILIICGAGFDIATLAYIIKQKGSTDVAETPDRLIDSRYFSVSRNPLYVSELILVLGVAFLTGSLAAFIGPAIFIAILNYFIVPYEERRLQMAFGKTYLTYKRSTRRWI